MKTLMIILFSQIFWIVVLMVWYLYKLSEWWALRYTGLCFSNVWRHFTDGAFFIIGLDIIVIFVITIIGIFGGWEEVINETNNK